MSTVKGAAVSVLERFPESWHVIVELCKDHEDFRELCDHYSECQMVLARLRDSIDTDRNRMTEYEATTRELESEIYSIIAAQPSREISVDRPTKNS
jgi:hypothetical protein